jgi:hypothetical protein
MSYILKHFDNSLIKFNITSSGIKGISVEQIEIYKKYKHFFPIFDNGLSLFNYAMIEDIKDIDLYAKTRLMANAQDFVTFAEEVITKYQKKKLKKLINFKFTKHKSYNLPSSRLKIMEVFIQKRVQELLAIPTIG